MTKLNPEVSKYMTEIVKKRWANTTKAQRSAHGVKMVQATKKWKQRWAAQLASGEAKQGGVGLE